ncbi:MAG TPA: hypothetical protein VME92_06210 [Acetobacteraceae bacterium]|nr:hypothetical protein [Acetobacteraceae bacterium]
MGERSGPTRRWSKRIGLAVSAIAVIAAAAAAGHFFHAGQPPEELRWKAGSKLGVTQTQQFRNDLTVRPAGDAADIAAAYEPDYGAPTLAVYSTAAVRPAAVALTIRDLSDLAQARAIDDLASDPHAAWPAILKGADGPDRGAVRQDPYRADRVLVATVTKGTKTQPGDRFIWTRVFIQPINFEFADYTVAATDNRSVKLASLETTVTRTLNLGGGLGRVAPALANPNATASSEETRKANADISEQYENLGIDIQPGFLRIIRESAAGGDVTGNVAIALSVVTDPRVIRRKYPGAADDRNQVENLALQVVDVQLASDGAGPAKTPPTVSVLPVDQLPHCALKAVVWMIYEERVIDRGRENYLEGLQTVHLLQDGEPKHAVEIVRADDISPAVWSVRILPRDVPLSVANIERAPTLLAQTNDATPRRLVFTDYRAASELIHWLKQNPQSSQLGTLHMIAPVNAGAWDALTLLPYKTTRDECQQPPPAARQEAGSGGSPQQPVHALQ